MPRPVVPPALPDRRALGRAALVTSLGGSLGLVTTVGFLLPVLEREAPLETRRAALASLGIWFRLGWLAWLPACLSMPVLANAWSRASRAGGLAGAAVPLVAGGTGAGLLFLAFQVCLLPLAIEGGDVSLLRLVESLLGVLVALPVVLPLGLGPILLAIRSARLRQLPRWLLVAGVPFLVVTCRVPLAWIRAPGDPDGRELLLWVLCLVLWQAGLGCWCLGQGRER